MIKNIIFDFDGVIHDTLHLAFEIVHKLNPNMTLEMYRDRFNGNNYEEDKKSPEKFRMYDVKKYFELQEIEFKKLKINNKVKKELLELYKNYQLFIVSSNQEKAIRIYLENNALNGIFKDILGYETHTSKEKKFNILIKKYDLTSEDSIYITDTLGDIIEARKVHLRALAVDFGFHERARLKKGKPLSILSKFEDIAPKLRALDETF
jgi:phosphoglycolate phosphatase